MKRYTVKKNITVSDFDARFNRQTTITSLIEEDENGHWVTWESAKAAIEFLEAQIPERRIAKLEKMVGLVSDGKCPECELRVRDYESPSGFFAPEAYASLREAGINPTTGHRQGCLLDVK